MCSSVACIFGVVSRKALPHPMPSSFSRFPLGILYFYHFCLGLWWILCRFFVYRVKWGPTSFFCLRISSCPNITCRNSSTLEGRGHQEQGDRLRVTKPPSLLLRHSLAWGLRAWIHSLMRCAMSTPGVHNLQKFRESVEFDGGRIHFCVH